MGKQIRDGGEPRRIMAQVIRILPILAWSGISIYLESWLTPKVWPTQRSNSMLFALIFCMGLAAIGVLRLSSNRSLADRIRRKWRGLSGPELVWAAVVICWLVALVAVLVTDQPRFFWSSEFWFESAVFLVLMGMLVSWAGMMVSIRRP